MSHILIVDDNQESLYMLEFLLKSSGFKVEKAANGAEALLKALENPPQMVITDILMPELDGYSLCREWMKSEELKAIPLVFYTATYTDPRDEQLALSLGAAQFIIKPQEPRKFLKILRDTIKKYEKGQALFTGQPIKSETVFLKQYNQTLIRKLEKKMWQLEKSNRSLKKEIEKHKLTEEALRKSEEGIKNSLEEKELLLKEIHHRVKNNLQIIISLLELQSHKFQNQDTLEAFQETKNRVYSMALAYDQLSQGRHFYKVDGRDFFSALANRISHIYDKERRISWEVRAQQIHLGIDLAVPCGLIVNELLMDAFKYAFPTNEPGQITLSFQRKNHHCCELIVRDSGAKTVDHLHLLDVDSIELQLVKALVEQINGSIKIEKEDAPPGTPGTLGTPGTYRTSATPGTKVVVEFPFPESEHD